MNLEIKNETGEVIAMFKQKNQSLKFRVSEKFEVGAVLMDSWGYDQTNYDFYVILERKGDYVKVQRLLKERGPEIGFQSMTNHVKPLLKFDPKHKPVRKKIKIYNGKETGFSFRGYSGGGWVHLWHGKEVTESHYA